MVVWEVRHYVSAQDKIGIRIAIFRKKSDAENFIESKHPNNDLEYRVSQLDRKTL